MTKFITKSPLSYSDLVNTANEQNLLVNPKVTPKAPN